MGKEPKEWPKPCPFCYFELVNIEEQKVSIGGKVRTMYYVKCPSCGNRGVELCETKKEAVKRWNDSQVKDKQPDLKPCPFCGEKQKKGKDSKVNLVSGYRCFGKERYMVRCGQCGAGTNAYSTEKEAKEAWNDWRVWELKKQKTIGEKIRDVFKKEG